MPYFKTENSNAENIKYDNTKSVKEAIDEIKDNVQDAITEVNGKLGTQATMSLSGTTLIITTK